MGDERGLIWQSHKIPLGIKKLDHRVTARTPHLFKMKNVFIIEPFPLRSFSLGKRTQRKAYVSINA
jgi:hypothetical protein